jgi:hypothetical protein
MERMTPDPEILATWQHKQVSVDQRVVAKRKADIALENDVVGKALGFWPPR